VQEKAGAMRAVVVAGVHSGVGKTTVATGLMAAYRRRGLRVQGFKVGPDYIDASYHTAACGRASRTLDGWMLGLDAVSELFAQAAAAADLCVIEGVMGLFDGRTGGRGAGSTAEIAALLGIPILLVVDGWKIARSAAAIVHGYRTFDPSIRIEGVVLNNIAGEGHYQAIAPPIEEETGVPVLGSLGHDDALALPERYLGLVPVSEGPLGEQYFDRLAATIERSLDLERILRIAETATLPNSAPSQLFPEEPQPARAHIAIAQDRAFSFYYPDSLDLLTAWGAEFVPFSPLDDAGLPEGTDGVYIGGGFPELFAAELAANTPMHEALQRAAGKGIPIYAECGGYMYAGDSLIDADGREHTMAGLLPLRSSMSGPRMTLGYREVRTLVDGPLAPAGSEFRGHEFHWSTSEPLPTSQAGYLVKPDRGGGDRYEGSVAGSVWGSYVHLHFGADPMLAPHFVETCSNRRSTPVTGVRHGH